MRARRVHTYEDTAKSRSRRNEYQSCLDAAHDQRHQVLPQRRNLAALRPHLEASPGGPSKLRAWSAGCASGEEPYTIAVLMTEVGAQGVIDATDVDRLSLERTRQAHYPDAASPRCVAPAAPLFRGRPAGAEVRELVRVQSHD